MLANNMTQIQCQFTNASVGERSDDVTASKSRPVAISLGTSEAFAFSRTPVDMPLLH